MLKSAYAKEALRKLLLSTIEDVPADVLKEVVELKDFKETYKPSWVNLRSDDHLRRNPKSSKE